MSDRFQVRLTDSECAYLIETATGSRRHLAGVAIVPGTTREQARARAERIRAFLEESEPEAGK